jgi:hypothetical protein
LRKTTNTQSRLSLREGKRTAVASGHRKCRQCQHQIKLWVCGTFPMRNIHSHSRSRLVYVLRLREDSFLDSFHNLPTEPGAGAGGITKALADTLTTTIPRSGEQTYSSRPPNQEAAAIPDTCFGLVVTNEGCLMPGVVSAVCTDYTPLSMTEKDNTFHHPLLLPRHPPSPQHALWCQPTGRRHDYLGSVCAGCVSAARQLHPCTPGRIHRSGKGSPYE